MSQLPRAARRLLQPRSLAPQVRPATAADVAAIQALVAPHVASGAVLPREIEPSAFLVAVVHEDGEARVEGCVALTPWTGEVVELGTLVSARAGLGRLLVEAACAAASGAGYSQIVALTAVGGFFERCGFEPQAEAPWAVARGMVSGPPAVAVKAARCAACPLLASCAQTLLARPLRARIAA